MYVLHVGFQLKYLSILFMHAVIFNLWNSVYLSRLTLSLNCKGIELSLTITSTTCVIPQIVYEFYYYYVVRLQIIVKYATMIIKRTICTM